MLYFNKLEFQSLNYFDLGICGRFEFSSSSFSKTDCVSRNSSLEIATISILQIIKVLQKKFNKDNIIIAYEPIWSIGTGKIPTKNELEETIIYIKKILKQIYKKKNPAVLYGGSVDGNSVKIFKDIKEIDGFLIGGASKSSKKFIDIIKNYYR